MPRQRNTTGWSNNNAERSKVGTPVSVSRITGAGKKASTYKNQLYSQPLPTHLDSVTAVTPSFSLWNALCAIATLGYYTPSHRTHTVRGASTSKDRVSVYYDRNLQTVWVVDMEQGLKLLWQRGFFGKGNLSRSEPAWRERRINEIDAVRRGRLTAEQLTQQRREERKALKIERARAAVRAGQQLPDGITALGGEVTDQDRLPGASHDRLMADIERQVEEQLADEDGVLRKSRPSTLWTGDEEVPDIVPGQARIKGLKYFSEEVKANQAKKKELLAQQTDTDALSAEVRTADIQVDDMERMQLSLIETFFLSGMLDSLEIHSDGVDGEVLTLDQFYRFCLQSSLPQPLLDLREQGLAERHLRTLYARPDNPFLINYVAYHHFRSLGWVVKTGIKFCADLLLYKRGPVFSHAEFAVVVIPSYQNPEDVESSPFTPHPNAGEKDWVWFSTVNRVQSQVLKTLILAHVSVPSIEHCPPSMLDTPAAFVESLKAGQTYSIKEVAIRRWVPARMKP